MASIGSALALGRSTSIPWVSNGAVTMKITSNTSMTSMYGTTLISPMSLRFCSGVAISIPQLGACVPVQDAREFFRETVVTIFESNNLVGITVVGNNSRYCCKQAH